MSWPDSIGVRYGVRLLRLTRGSLASVPIRVGDPVRRLRRRSRRRGLWLVPHCRDLFACCRGGGRRHRSGCASRREPQTGRGTVRPSVGRAPGRVGRRQSPLGGRARHPVANGAADLTPGLAVALLAYPCPFLLHGAYGALGTRKRAIGIPLPGWVIIRTEARPRTARSGSLFWSLVVGGLMWGLTGLSTATPDGPADPTVGSGPT